jgi:hypothetical protein
MTNIDNDMLATVTGGLTRAQRFQVSSWVNDQFEIGSPKTLAHAPNGTKGMESWVSDPASGQGGKIYRKRDTDRIYLNASGGWFSPGRLTDGL